MFKSKFIKITIIMALLLNLFSGVVFAVEDTAVKIEIDQDQVTFIEGFKDADITGRIVNSATNAVYAVNTELRLYKDADGDGIFSSQRDTPIEGALGTTVSAGTFSLSILTNDQGVTGIGQYFVVGIDASGYHFTDYATFRIQYDISLVEPTSLEWTYQMGSMETIFVEAAFRNGDNSYDVSEIVLRYQDGASIATANYADQASTGFLFSEEKLFKTGPIGLYVGGVLALEGEVFPQELALQLSPTELVSNLGEVSLGFDFELDTEFTQLYRATSGSGVALRDGYDLKFTLKIPLADDDMGLEQYVYDAYMFPENPLLLNMSIGNRFADGRIELPFNPRKEIYYLGDYEVVVDLVDTIDSFIVKTTSRTLGIVDADDFNLVAWNSSALCVGENTFTFNDRMADRPVVVLDEIGLDYLGSAKFQGLEITISGCGVEEVFTTLAIVDVDDKLIIPGGFTIKPNVTGSIEVTIEVYNIVDKAFAGASLETFRRELMVKGWNVEISPTVVDVGDEVDIMIMITDENDIPINNAVITSGGSNNILIDGTRVNTVGGTYLIEFDDEVLPFDEVRKIDLEFWKKTALEEMADPEIVLVDAIEVVGLNIYHVTANKEALLQGFEDEVAITALGFAFDIIHPIFLIEYFDEYGASMAIPQVLLEGVRVDLDGDQVNESVSFVLLPPAGAVTAVVKAASANGKAYGEVEIPVYRPQVESAIRSISAFIDTEWELSIIDPRDGSVMNNAIYLEVDNEYLGDVNYVQAFIYHDDSWFGEVLLPEVSFERAEEAGEDLYLELYLVAAEEDVLLKKIPVKAAEVVSTPPGVILGTATTIEIAYLDAEGIPLSGYDVLVDSESIGSTDEAGTVFFSTATGSTQTIVVECATDVEGEVTMANIASIIDLEAPQASVSESGKTATITIIDNVRVYKATVNDKDVSIIFPQPMVTYQTPRAKSYIVRAIDSNFNYSETTLAGTLPPADPKILNLNIGQETKYGTIELVDGTTVVPVRYAVELGATIEWDPDIKMVTYAIKNNGTRRISVVIDSTTALVNGENVQMVFAPFINDKGRTMVPLRMIAQELGFSVDWQSGGYITIR